MIKQLLFVSFFCLGLLYAADSKENLSSEKLTLDGKKAAMLATLNSVGKFGSPNWRSSITINKKGSKGTLYSEKSLHSLQMITLLPSLSDVKQHQGGDVFFVGYLVAVDGLDPDQYVLIVIYGDRIYKNTAKVEKDEDVSMEALKVSSSMPIELQKLANKQWYEFVQHNK